MSERQELLDRLVRENLGWLRGWVGARLRGRRAQDADDVCQEILLRAVRGVDRLKDPERFPAWLYRIANNVLRDHFRRWKTERRMQQSLEVEPIDTRQPEAASLEVDEELSRVVDALLDLPERYREPMLIRHVDDLSYAEIGRILGISENAVQVRIFRARKMLRETLEGASSHAEVS